MALDRIKELLKLMEQNDLAEMEIEEEGCRIRLVKNASREAAGPATVVVSQGPAAGTAQASLAAAPPGPAAGGAGEEPVPEGLQEITSPIVGTFYRAPSPDADPFVDVGSRVEVDTTLCIIEAMKVMNEVKAEITGVIRKVLVPNGQPVEYGQPIFLIEPAG